MDATSILREILGGNATNSGRIRDIQRDQGGRSRIAEPLEDLLGVHNDDDVRPQSGSRSPQREREVAPTQGPRQRQSVPKWRSGGLPEDLLGGLIGKGKRSSQPAPEPPRQRQRERRPSQEQQEQAVFLIRAMCHAAKVDGSVDRQEQDAILGRLDEVTEEELNFVRKEFNSPLDVTQFCRSVPDDLAEQVYAFSVMAIKLDTLKEAAYLGRLAQGLQVDERTCNRLHAKVGAPSLYA